VKGHSPVISEIYMHEIVQNNKHLQTQYVSCNVVVFEALVI